MSNLIQTPMIERSPVILNEHPLLSGISDETLIDQVRDGSLSLPQIILHTQPVERTVELVNEVSLKAMSYEERHGYILATSNLVKFDTKKDFFKI